MDLRDMPTTYRDRIRRCDCGCDNFRFKVVVQDKHVYANLCRNCNHTLSEHLHLPSVEN